MKAERSMITTGQGTCLNWKRGKSIWRSFTKRHFQAFFFFSFDIDKADLWHILHYFLALFLSWLAIFDTLHRPVSTFHIWLLQQRRHTQRSWTGDGGSCGYSSSQNIAKTSPPASRIPIVMLHLPGLLSLNPLARRVEVVEVLWGAVEIVWDVPTAWPPRFCLVDVSVVDSWDVADDITLKDADEPIASPDWVSILELDWARDSDPVFAEEERLDNPTKGIPLTVFVDTGDSAVRLPLVVDE